MRGYFNSYRRSPYSIIVSRWKRHFLHLLAFVGFCVLVYGIVMGKLPSWS